MSEEEKLGWLADTILHERLHYLWHALILDLENKTSEEDTKAHQKIREAVKAALVQVFEASDDFLEKIGRQYPHSTKEYIWIIPGPFTPTIPTPGDP